MQKKMSRYPAPEERDSPTPTVVNIPSDLEGKKAFLTEWIHREKIPGKFQAWFSLPSEPGQADWRIISETRGNHQMLMIEPPYKGMTVPPLVLDIDTQLRKEHLTSLRRSLLQIWIRSTGDGRYGILVQTILRSADAAHAFKSFIDFIERSHPEVLCCHQVQTRPFLPFDPSFPPKAMRADIRVGFGSEFLPIAKTGLFFHILDWTPRCKAAWIHLPEKLLAAIHPVKGDRFLEFHSGPAYLSVSLASAFESVHAVDYRMQAKSSALYNIHTKSLDNVRFHQEHLEPEWLVKFFSERKNEGKWTVLLNPPRGEALSTGTIQVLAQSRPERILLISSNLDIASKEIRRFRREGYMLRKALPLDLEPGKAAFEVLFFFVPDRAGLLGRKEELGKKLKPQKPSIQPFRDEESDIPHFVQQKRPISRRKG